MDFVWHQLKYIENDEFQKYKIICFIQIDPYINIDAGTFSPYEHGEVFVLDDGG